MTHNQRSPGPIPERWLNCPRKSSALVAGKFLAFKTPLSDKFNDQIPEHCRFNTNFLFDVVKSYKWKIGLWIDLTNTSRFYDKEDVEKEDCKYLKLQCRGHGGAPNEEQTQTFIKVCHQFITYHPLEIIGVHCTHGFNRTGFLIISYLVEKMDCSVEAAVTQFSSVRPPGIYKKDYLEELFKKYDDVRYAPAAPELPDWCTESDDGDRDVEDSEDGVIHNEERSSGGARRKEFKKKNPTFMVGVPGVTPVTDSQKLHYVQRRVQDMCAWKSSGFPGCQPVSMDNANIRLLHEKPYKVSWKADGTRYMMLISKENEVFFIDRDNCVFQVSGLTFPHRKNPSRHLRDTLLDGEMVIDKVDGKDIPRYLAYDIIRFEGQDVGSQTFDPIRLTCIDKEIVQPRRMAMGEGRINRTMEPFSIRLKQFWDVTQAGSLLSEKFAKSLSHEPDGLIFQPAKDPYSAGQCKEVLKWKPSSLNSVDFKLKIVTEVGEGNERWAA
ncbi:Probable tyrosine-protein phosphatase F54C8.4 [Gryllus bimaculatus]|nr:Probable tyrosine-protein phosphatase F54C8.4 [Gryllus bimaculatus]